MEIPPPLCQGRYTLRKLLGEGGMATVYVAYDRLLDVHRAIKLLAPRLCRKPKIRQRFLDEARAMARLQHSNIVAVHDVGLEGESQPYIIMQLIGGGSVGDVFENCGPQPPSIAGPIILGALNGLQAAHEAGIIHRDIKPHNILLTRGGQPKITDFGIAHLENTDHSMTRTGAVLGTLAYMAPEQRRNTKGVGPQADIYAAGATLFALLTAEEPFDLYAKELQEKLIADIPPPLQEVICRACDYEPTQRYSSANAMAVALHEALVELGVELRPDGSILLPEGLKALSGSWDDEDLENASDSDQSVRRAGSLSTSLGDFSQNDADSGPNYTFADMTQVRRRKPWLVAAVGLAAAGSLTAWWLATENEPVKEPQLVQVEEQQCGNGVRDPGESCDDGNNIDSDVCTSSCELNLVFLHGSTPSGNVFTMGRDTPYSDREDASMELPATKVILHPFWMLRHEVTRESYAEVMAQELQPDSVVPNKKWLEQGALLPANQVSYEQAKRYCKLLGGVLPTEAQWEYAARGGGRDITYPWGNEEPTCERVVLGQHDCSMGRPRPVCSRPKGNTAQGLCDMSGNVFEWVRPAFHHSPEDDYPRYPGNPGDRPEIPAAENEIRSGNWEYDLQAGGEIDGSPKWDIIRGGGYWMTVPFYNRSRARYFLGKGDVEINVGFRCIWDPHAFPLPDEIPD